MCVCVCVHACARMHACVLSPVQLFVAQWTVPQHALLSMEFSRQEYRSGLPFPTPGDLLNLGIEHMSVVPPALAVLYHCFVCMHAKLLKSCPTLCNPMDYSHLGFSVHGILQVRILEWVAKPSSRGSSPPRYRTCISCALCIGRHIVFHCFRGYRFKRWRINSQR